MTHLLYVMAIVAATSLATRAGPQQHLTPLALALDTTLALLRDPATPRLSANEKIYLRETMYHRTGHGIREDRLPKSWLDSLVRVHHLSGHCSGRVQICDIALTGTVLEPWRPSGDSMSASVVIDVRSVRIYRPTFSGRPAFERDSTGTPVRDRLQIQYFGSQRAYVECLADSAGHWHIAAVTLTTL